MAQIPLLLGHFRDLNMALRRQWAKGAACAAALMALALAGLLVMPRQYVSESKLFVRFGRNLILDPSASATSGQMVSIYETRENELNSLLEVLSSRALLDRVVEAIGSEAILRGQLPGDLPPLGSVLQRHAIGEQLPAIAGPELRDARHQKAVRKLQQSLQVSVPKKSSTIVISAKAETPQLAQRIVATLVTLYMDEHLRVHHTPGSFEFFRDERDLLERQWNDASAALRDAKNRFGIVTLAGKRKLIEDQLADVEMQLAREAFKYQAEERRLSAQFAAAHPQVQAIRGVLQELTSALRQPAATDAAQGEPHDQAHSTARDTLSTLGSQRQRLLSELAELNGQELIVTRLEREAELAQERLTAYAQKAEQARINERLDQQRITNLSIIQPASYSSQPAGPRRLYVLALALLVSVGGGIGLAIVCDHADPLIRTPRDLEQCGLPVAGRVPDARGPLETAV